MRRDFSDQVISRVDKDRRGGAAKERDARITAEARVATMVSLLKVSAPDLVRHCDGILDAVRDVLSARIGAASASSRIAAKAEQAIISGPNARARAEQLFRPANDGDAA